MKYDYIIIGSGLFGSVFAHELGKMKKRSRLLSVVIMLVVMYIVRILKELMFINMAHIYFILTIKKYGIM